MAGTTVEDAGQVPAAFSAALHRHGMTVSDDDLRAVRGASKRAAIRHLVELQGTIAPAEMATQTEIIYLAFRDQLLQNFADAGLRPESHGQRTGPSSWPILMSYRMKSWLSSESL